MKAVIGVDGSKYSEWALGWLGRIPFRVAPRVMAIHTIDFNSARTPFVTHPTVTGYEPDVGEAIHSLESRAKRVETETKQRMRDLGLTGAVRVEKGQIAQALLKHAGGTALIVVGSRGLDAIDRFMLGSVSTAIALHASSPVLIVKEPPQTLRRVLVATDGSASSGRAIQFLLRQLKIIPEAEPIVILLVHVMPFLRYTVVKEAGEKLLAREAASLERAGYLVRQIPRVGPAAEEILRVVSLEQPDLIVTGAKGRSAVTRFLQGSVSTKLIHQTACSALIVR